jgi:hypothetical protein
LLLAWDGVATFFENLSQTVTGMSLADAGRAILQGLADGIVGGLALATDAIGAVASGIMQKFKEWLGINSPSTVFAEFGGWIMDGLKDGLLAKLTAVTEAVGNIASTVAEKFKGWLGISSPSKVFAGFGGDVIAGLAVGMRANEGLAADRVAGLSRAVKAAAAGAVAGAVAGTPAMAVPELGAMTPPAPALMAPPVAPEFPARPPAPGAGPVNVTLQVTVQGDATRETVQDLEETLTRWVHSNGRMLTDVVGREAERRGRMDFGGG